MSKVKQKRLSKATRRRTDEERVLAALRDGGLTFEALATVTKLPSDRLHAALMNIQEERVQQHVQPRSRLEVYRLSPYERDGFHPNAGEVMAWLEDRPLPRSRIEEDRPEMRAALKQLVKRGLVKTTCGGDICYRRDRAAHMARGQKLLKMCALIEKAFYGLHEDDQSTAMSEVFDVW